MANANNNQNSSQPQNCPESYTLSVSSVDEVASIVQTPQLTPSTKTKAFELLQPVFFVGFMVAGKTSVSRFMSRSLCLPTVDLDAYIESQNKCAINEIFAKDGEEAFRDMETAVLYKFARKRPMLISCGGGVVLREENRKIMKGNGFVVYLQVTADEAAKRIGDVSTRPNFKNVEVARQTIQKRLPMYEAAASCSVNTVGKSISVVASEVKDILLSKGVLVNSN